MYKRQVQTSTGLQNNNRDIEELELNEPAFGQFIKFIVDSDGREININEIELYNLSGAQPPSSNVAAPEANLPSGTYYKDEIQQVILSSQTDGAEKMCIRDRDRACIGAVEFADLSGRLKAVHAGHLDVHQNQIVVLYRGL